MLKMIEIIGVSEKGFTEAVNNAVEIMAKDGFKMHFFQVIEHRGSVKDGKIREFQVLLKIAVE